MDFLAGWSQIKAFSQARTAPIQYLDLNGNYYLYVNDGPFALNMIMSQELDGNGNKSADCVDFETNFKPTANQSSVSKTSVEVIPPYGAKTVIVNGVTKKLYSRFTGIQASVNPGANTINYTMTYAWAKVIGIEVVNATALDTCNLKIYDNAQGTYSGVPNLLLNQFSYSLNLPDGYYIKMAQFDADIYQGMVISFEYTSTAALAKTLGINILMNEVK